MAEGIGPGQNEVQPEQPKKPEGFELKPNPENAERVRFMQENSRPGAEQPWSTGRVVSNEQADAQIAKAMEELKAKVSPELYERVVQAGGKPDGDEFKTQVANELRQAIGDEAFNQFNADTTVSRPFIPFDRRGASPTTTRAHGEDSSDTMRPLWDVGYRTKYAQKGETPPFMPPEFPSDKKPESNPFPTIAEALSGKADKTEDGQ